MEFKVKYTDVLQIEGKLKELFPNDFTVEEVVIDSDTYKELVVSSADGLSLIFATFFAGEWTIKINELS